MRRDDPRRMYPPGVLDRPPVARRGVASPTQPLTLDAIYPIPNPHETFEQAWKYRHKDLDDLPRAEIVRDLKRLELRLLLDDANVGPDPWLLDRLERLRRKVRDGR